MAWVYPRPRGGTAHERLRRAGYLGLSPPTRGNRTHASDISYRRWSIPAHAGEPAASLANPRNRRVYPRPRGGTIGLIPRVVRLHGLSPPTRGNHVVDRDAPASARSIPAHAGEPTGLFAVLARNGVYPRPRGGTAFTAQSMALLGGLSPPTRGNHPRSPQTAHDEGSIPAHAGEPNAAYEIDVGADGLSPPTRGNPAMLVIFSPATRSIPAHAGEPPGSRSASPRQ